MTEPGTAGSDPTLLATRAVRDGDDWVIDGRKWFTLNGSVSDFLVVMVVTDPDAAAEGPSVDAHRPHRFTGCDHRPGSRDDGRARPGPSGASGPAATDIRKSSTSPSESLPRTCSAASETASGSPSFGSDPVGFSIACAGSVSRSARSTCSASARSHVLRTGAISPKRASVQAWVADSAAEILAARLMTLYAAWKIDQFGAQGCPHRDRLGLVMRIGPRMLSGSRWR